MSTVKSVLSSIKKYEMNNKSTTLSYFLLAYERNLLDLNPKYQRDYVWTKREQDFYLNALIRNFPAGNIAVVIDKDFNIEVVDGKQRITTILLFVDNMISVNLDGKEYFYNDLTTADHRKFGNISVPSIELLSNSYKDRLQYFLTVNFSGVPQSNDHRRKVEQMLAECE